MTPTGIGLMLVSLLLDLPSILLRVALAAVAVGLVGRLGVAADVIAGLFAFGPPLRSLAALALPLPAGILVRAAAGARRPSDQEEAAVAAAVAQLGDVPMPRSVRVVDGPEENAWVMGTTLFLSRGLFEGPHLVAIVAHEAGHLDEGDGQVALAAWWLPVRSLAWLAERLLAVHRDLPPGRALPRAAGGGPAPARRGVRLGGLILRLPALCMGACLLVVAGGLFPMLLRPTWLPYRRNREYAADAFTARHGLGPALMEALGDWQVLDVATPWWQGRSHPYIEQRLDHLRRLATGRDAQA